MRLTVTNYLDVVSSWCFWTEPTWAELKRRYADRVQFDWKIALMDAEGLPKSRAQEEWFYRRSGMLMRSPFMLRTEWYEPVLPEYLVPNLVAEAARDLGVADDTVRLAISRATLREGVNIRDAEIAGDVAAKASGLDKQRLIERSRSPEIEKRIRESTAEWKSLKVSQRPTIVIDSEIGDCAVFSGFAKIEPLAATLDAMLDDLAGYDAHAAHFGGPPAE